MDSLLPATTPLPLPAPVELFRGLELLTVPLHLAAVHLLLGGLVIVILGSLARDPRSPPARAAREVSTRLPLVLTYVINFGVPPLLFLQLLYGQAFYTAALVQGFAWLAMVPLLGLGYLLLYVATLMIQKGRSPLLPTLAAAPALAGVGLLFSAVLNCMIHPEAWRALHRAAPAGTLTYVVMIPTRLRFLGAAGMALLGAGVAAWWLAERRGMDAETQKGLHAAGALGAGVGATVGAIGVMLAQSAYPAVARAALTQGGAKVAALAIPAGLTLALLASLAGAIPPEDEDPETYRRWARRGATAGYLVSLLGLVVVRQVMRDAALLAQGLDVSARSVLPNWGAVGAFGACLLLAVVAVGWMALVSLRAPAPVLPIPGEEGDDGTAQAE